MTFQVQAVFLRVRQEGMEGGLSKMGQRAVTIVLAALGLKLTPGGFGKRRQLVWMKEGGKEGKEEGRGEGGGKTGERKMKTKEAREEQQEEEEEEEEEEDHHQHHQHQFYYQQQVAERQLQQQQQQYCPQLQHQHQPSYQQQHQPSYQQQHHHQEEVGYRPRKGPHPFVYPSRLPYAPSLSPAVQDWLISRFRDDRISCRDTNQQSFKAFQIFWGNFERALPPSLLRTTPFSTHQALSEWLLETPPVRATFLQVWEAERKRGREGGMTLMGRKAVNVVLAGLGLRLTE
eukprot:evm.model.NODE_8131_length_8215_cov_46.570297.1